MESHETGGKAQGSVSESMKMLSHPPTAPSHPTADSLSFRISAGDSRRALPFSSPFMLFIHLAMDFHRFFPRRKIYSSQHSKNNVDVDSQTTELMANKRKEKSFLFASEKFFYDDLALKALKKVSHFLRKFLIVGLPL